METSAFGFSGIPLASEQPPELIYESGSGYCRVYSAVRRGRRIALKVLKPEYLDSAIHRDLLRKEYEIGHTLYHPNIASTLGFEDIDGLGPAIVMEFVDGITLEEYLTTNRTMKRDVAMAVTEQICDALSYLHSHQLLHRDLKPANIMLTHSGRYVKLIDFGLSDGTAFTDYKYAGGTRSYSAPEQLNEGIDNDPRIDIYSLGVIMQEMCRVHGGGYGKTASRCCSDNPDKRPADVSKIPETVRHLDKVRRRNLAVLASVTVIAIGVAVAMYRPVEKQTSPLTRIKEPAVTDTVMRIVHDTVRVETSAVPLLPENSVESNVPALAPQKSLAEEYLSREKIDAMISYAQNYTRSELERWYSSDSAAHFPSNEHKIIQHLDKYVEEQCGGDATAIALVKPAITETASSTMRKFHAARRDQQK